MKQWCLKFRSRTIIIISNNKPFLKDTLQSYSCLSLKSLKKYPLTRTSNISTNIIINQPLVTRLPIKLGTVHLKALNNSTITTCWSRMMIQGKISQSSLKVTRLSIRQAHRKAERLTCHWQWRQRPVRKRYRMRSSIESMCTKTKLSKLVRLAAPPLIHLLSMQPMQDFQLGAEAALQILHRQRCLSTHHFMLASLVLSKTRRQAGPHLRSNRLSKGTCSGESFTR